MINSKYLRLTNHFKIRTYLTFLLPLLLLVLERHAFTTELTESDVTDVKEQNDLEGQDRVPASLHKTPHTNLHDTPPEIQSKIHQYLDPKSKARMMQVSKQDNAIAKKDQELNRLKVEKFQRTLPEDVNILDEAVFRNRPDIIHAAGNLRNLRPTDVDKIHEHILTAAKNNDTKLLNAYYANPEVNETYRIYGYTTPLHMAAKQGRTEILKALIEARANPDVKDSGGNTPLHYAVIEGHTETVKALIEGKANPNVENLDKKTALDVANEKGYPDIRDLLTEAIKRNLTPKSSSTQ